MRFFLCIIASLVSFRVDAAETIEELFGKARKQAWHVLDATPPEAVDYSVLKEEIAIEKAKKFYTEHYTELLEEAADFADSASMAQAKIHFVLENSNGAQGETGKNRLDPIFISTSACLDQNVIDSVGAATRILLGEYVHHFGQGDEMTDWIKKLVMDSYEKNYPDDKKKLFEKIDPFEPSADGNYNRLKWAYFSPNAKQPQLFTIAHGSRYDGISLTLPTNKIGDTEIIHITNGPIRWDPKTREFSLKGVYHITGYRVTRAYGFDLKEPVVAEQTPNGGLAFDLKFQVIQNDRAIKLTYQFPEVVNLNNKQVVLKPRTQIFLTNPGDEARNALFEKNRRERQERDNDPNSRTYIVPSGPRPIPRR